MKRRYLLVGLVVLVFLGVGVKVFVFMDVFVCEVFYIFFGMFVFIEFLLFY